MADFGNIMKNIIIVVILAVVVTAVLQGLKTTALTSAYDASANATITDTAGTEHFVEASPISGDLTALMYSIAQGLVWLVAILGILFMVFRGLKGGKQ